MPVQVVLVPMLNKYWNEFNRSTPSSYPYVVRGTNPEDCTGLLLQAGLDNFESVSGSVLVFFRQNGPYQTALADAHISPEKSCLYDRHENISPRVQKPLSSIYDTSVKRLRILGYSTLWIAGLEHDGTFEGAL
jgi:hypothetical protein